MTAGEVFWTGLLLMAAVVLLFGTAAWAIYHLWPGVWAWLLPADDDEATDARAELHCLDEKPIDHDEVARFLAMHAGANAAKRRRIASGEQQMQRIWRNTTGGGSDAA